MKAIALTIMAALALPACDKASAERDADKTERSRERESSSDEEAPVKKVATATAAPTASVAAKPSATAEDEDTPEVADASGAPPAPTAGDDAFKDVSIPAGVTIPTEEDYEEKAEKEITAANFEAELAKIEKELTP